MSITTLFSPGWGLDAVLNIGTNPAMLLIPPIKKAGFAPKADNKTLQSYYWQGSTVGQIPVTSVKRTAIANIYSDTGVVPAAQMRLKSGQHCEVSVHALGESFLQNTSPATTTPLGVAPITMTVSFDLPDALLSSDTSEMNSYCTLLLTSCLSLLASNSDTASLEPTGVKTSFGETSMLDFYQVLSGTKDLRETANESAVV